MNGNRYIRILIFLLLISLIVWASFNYRDQLNPTNIQYVVNSYGIWAPLIFILMYATAVVLALPGLIMTMMGGFIFGPVYGTLINITGAVIGSTLAFLIARYLASDWVAEKVGGRLKQVINGVEEEGWRFVAFVRFVPIFPYNILNFALGLTRIRLIEYVLASAIFMLPVTFAYTYVGSLGQTALAGETRQFVTRLFIALGLLVLVGAIPYIVRKIRNKKNENRDA